MRIKTTMLCTVVLALGGCYSGGSMWKSSGARYTPRTEISQNKYTPKERQQDRIDAKSYKQYEEREPCERYRAAPRNYSDGCVSNMMEEEIIVVAAPKPAPAKAILPIVRSYTVLFDLNKADIRSGENKTLDRAMNEISKYQPKQVTVTGYADSSGKATYNQALSYRREEAVSKALMQRGIKNQTLDREARGEYEQAVKTADGVRNQENRRVVIDFRR